ncbi:MAG: sulfotransferase domain-containing protein [Gammaproteobacteria bacterium]|nr:sulfotransferase domain-containing protein [Gammaproteobacteria bacterium]
MLSKLVRKIKNRLTSRNRDSKFFDKDIFLVSYPKSGNTWLRFLLAHYIKGGKVDLLESNLIIPDVHYNSKDITTTLSPRIIKTHELFKPKYKRVVYIVRDGRDVAVSYFYHLKKFNRLRADTTFSDFLLAFIDGELDSIGPWGEHVNGWLDGAKDLILIRYEDMLTNPECVLENVVKFCGLEFDKKKILDSVKTYSLEELKKIETRQFYDVKELATSDPKIYFFRKGVAGDWANHFNEEDSIKFNKSFFKTMNRLGYE